MYHPIIRVEANSIWKGQRLITVVIENFPCDLLREINTHGTISKNAGSTRAVSVEKLIAQVENDPFIPVFTSEQKGMQGEVIPHDTLHYEQALQAHLDEVSNAVKAAKRKMALGLHKQDCNLPISPYALLPWVGTATESRWREMLSLRTHPTAKPTFRLIALEIERVINESNPKESYLHLPFFSEDLTELPLWDQLMVCVARLARVSYGVSGGSNVEKDLKLANRLLTDRHMSPFEHIAICYPWYEAYSICGRFYKHSLESELCYQWGQLRGIIQTYSEPKELVERILNNF